MRRTAAEYLDYRASARCDDCAQLPGGRCESHADDLARAAAYHAVADRLEGSR
jgi:hypothetical protein